MQGTADVIAGVYKRLNRPTTFARFRMQGCALAGTGIFFLTAVQPCVVAAYLPVVGPSPIRFQAPPKPPSLLLKQYPLPVPSPSVATHTPPSTPETNIAAASSSPETIAVKSPPGPDEATSIPNEPGQLPALAEPANQSDVLTPQMLVPFFHQRNAGGKSSETGVYGPLIFAPPRPGPKPSSTATLKTP
jgi:hypothetical protein